MVLTGGRIECDCCGKSFSTTIKEFNKLKKISVHRCHDCSNMLTIKESMDILNISHDSLINLAFLQDIEIKRGFVPKIWVYRYRKLQKQSRAKILAQMVKEDQCYY